MGSGQEHRKLQALLKERRDQQVAEHRQEEEDDQGEVFLDDSDILNEIAVDDEDLPDVDDDDDDEILDFDDDGEDTIDEADDSIHIFTGHTGELYSVACSPTDAALVATGGGDNRGFLWMIGHGDWAFELQGHKESVSSLAFSHDGQLLAPDVSMGLFRYGMWPQEIVKEPLKDHARTLRGHYVLAGFKDASVWMWNADTSAYLNIFSGHSGSVTCGDFTPDGKTICTGSDDATPEYGTLRLVKTFMFVRGYPYHTDEVNCLAISSDSSLAFTGAKDSSIYIVNIASGKVVSSLPGHSGSIECVGLAPSMDKKLIIWDLQRSSPRATCDHEDGVNCLTWVGTSRFLATGCEDGKVQVWDSLSGDCVRTFSGHSDAIQSLSVSANKDFLVSVSLDGTARVFEIGELQ